MNCKCNVLELFVCEIKKIKKNCEQLKIILDHSSPLKVYLGPRGPVYNPDSDRSSF